MFEILYNPSTLNSTSVKRKRHGVRRHALNERQQAFRANARSPGHGTPHSQHHHVSRQPPVVVVRYARVFERIGELKEAVADVDVSSRY